MKVSILGTEYEVIFDTLAENKRYKGYAGYCDHNMKRIHVRKHTHDDTDRDEMTIDDDAMVVFENKCLRHELIHAFMYESGLDANTHDIESWARDEEMVDWMAIQMPKIMKAYESIIGVLSIDVTSVNGNTRTIEYTDQELREYAGIPD